MHKPTNWVPSLTRTIGAQQVPWSLWSTGAGNGSIAVAFESTGASPGSSEVLPCPRDRDAVRLHSLCHAWPSQVPQLLNTRSSGWGTWLESWSCNNCLIYSVHKWKLFPCILLTVAFLSQNSKIQYFDTKHIKMRFWRQNWICSRLERICHFIVAWNIILINLRRKPESSVEKWEHNEK